ncbi:unnamed protein product [Symbiodinium sp. CCMP2592]|nr:unnamed protein product [Symbiodinium sp. CCMP2592]
MPPKKRPAAAIAADDDEEEPRKSRKGFKEWHKLRDALLPFIDKRFFTSYPTDRSIAKIDKKKLCSPFFVIKGILNNCRQLSPTWNFPDTVIKKALLGVLKHEDSIYCWVLDKAHLAEQVKEADRDAWSTTNSLRLSAAFRHYSQATLRQREWVPKAGAHKPLRRLASDEPTGKRRLRRVTGKQRDQSRDPPKAQPKAQPQDEVACEDMDGEHGADDVSGSDDSSSSSSSSSDSSTSTNKMSSPEANNQPDHEPEKEPADNEPADNEPPPKVQEAAAAFLANDWFLNTLDGVMGGFDPSASGASYLSPTPGPSRRRETQLLESPAAEEPPRNKRKADEEPKPENNKRKPSLKKMSAFVDEKDKDAEKDSEKQSNEKTRKKQSDKKAPEKQSDKKAPEKQSNEKAPEKQSEKAPEKQSNEKAPEKHSDKKAPKKQSEKAPEKHSDKKAPEKHSDKKAPEKQSKKAPEKQSNEKAPEKQSDKKAPESNDKAPENQSKQKAAPELKQFRAQIKIIMKLHKALAKTQPNLAQDKRQPGDIWWDYEMQRACLESQTGPVFSSKPFVKEDEVFVQFPDGLMWSVPHLVPADLESGLGLPAPTVPEQKPKAASKRKPKADKPIEDYVYSIIRCKYCTQGSKNPLIKVEAREDRHDATSRWVQKLQLVIRTGLSVRKAMHIAMTFADCYVYMNLNPAEINYRGCRDDLLAHDHDWEASALDWQTVNSLGLKHFPKSPKESPIKIPKPTQTQIVDDQAKNEPQGDDDDDAEGDEEEDGEHDPAVEEGF